MFEFAASPNKLKFLESDEKLITKKQPCNISNKPFKLSLQLVKAAAMAQSVRVFFSHAEGLVFQSHPRQTLTNQVVTCECPDFLEMAIINGCSVSH